MWKKSLGYRFLPPKAKAELCVLGRWKHKANQVASSADLLAPTAASSVPINMALAWTRQDKSQRDFFKEPVSSRHLNSWALSLHVSNQGNLELSLMCTLVSNSDIYPSYPLPLLGMSGVRRRVISPGSLCWTELVTASPRASQRLAPSLAQCL